jgi:hypothetical protein
MHPNTSQVDRDLIEDLGLPDVHLYAGAGGDAQHHEESLPA